MPSSSDEGDPQSAVSCLYYPTWQEFSSPVHHKIALFSDFSGIIRPNRNPTWRSAGKTPDESIRTATLDGVHAESSEKTSPGHEKPMMTYVGREIRGNKIA